jgi:hypothetical protein
MVQWSDYLFLALAFAPTAYSFYVGQINAFILLLLAAVYFLLEKDKEILAGIVLAVSILLKVAPVLFVLYMLIRKRYIALISTTMVVTGIVLITIPTFGSSLSTYLATVLPRLPIVPQPDPVNQSLNGFFGRMFTKNDWATPIYDAPLLYRILTPLACIVFILLTAIKLMPDNSTLSESYNDTAFGAFVTLMTIISPLAWQTLHILLAFPLIVLFGRWARISRSQRFLLGVSMFLLNVQTLWALFHSSLGKFPVLRYFWPLMSLGLCGAITLLLLQIGIIKSGIRD